MHRDLAPTGALRRHEERELDSMAMGRIAATGTERTLHMRKAHRHRKQAHDDEEQDTRPRSQAHLHGEALHHVRYETPGAEEELPGCE